MANIAKTLTSFILAAVSATRFIMIDNDDPGNIASTEIANAESVKVTGLTHSRAIDLLTTFGQCSGFTQDEESKTYTMQVSTTLTNLVRKHSWMVPTDEKRETTVILDGDDVTVRVVAITRTRTSG